MTKQQKFSIDIPDGYSADDLEAMGSDIVQFIRDRCAVGMGVRKRGRGFQTYPFPEYTPEYRDFKGQRRVDLVLSGDMLDALSVLKIDKDKMKIVIGYEAGDEINGKVEGNVTGSYGKDAANPKKARNFLGITGEELNAIIGVYETKD